MGVVIIKLILRVRQKPLSMGYRSGFHLFSKTCFRRNNAGGYQKEEVLFSKPKDDCGLTISSQNFAKELVKKKKQQQRVNFEMESKRKYVLLP